VKFVDYRVIPTSHNALIGDRSSLGEHCSVYPNVVIESDVIIEDGVTLFHGAIIGKPPKVAGVVARTPQVNNPFTRIGKGAVIGANAVIYAGAQVGESVLIGDGVTIREDTRIGDETVVGSNSTIQNGAIIGDRVKIVDLSHITYDCVIEDEAFISVGVYTMNDNSMQRGGKIQGPVIEHRARVGGGALLLPGVRVGEDAVVGAGAVVTKNVPAGDQVLGIPAKRAEGRPNRQVFGGFSEEELWDMYFFPESRNDK
jgi:acetyltransferase-like isoleucine patch superfamily enzyme